MGDGSSRGVHALASLMFHLAKGEPVRASEFAEANGLARSSVFDLARRMQEAGFLVRDANGALQAGPAAYELAWSAHGLAGLRGPAEAVIVWLRDQIDGDVSLTAGDDELLAIHRPGRSRAAHEMRQATIRDHNGSDRLTLTVGVSEQVDRQAAEAAIGRAVATLEHHIGFVH